MILRALDVGSGHNPVRDSGWWKPGDTAKLEFTNMDGFWLPIDKTDVHHDFNELPWPFEANTFDFVFLRHTLEHVRHDRFVDVMREIHRVCKNGAFIFVRVPYWNSESFAGDPTHWNPFCETTFKHFCYGGSLGTEYYVPSLFRAVEMEFRFQPKFRFLPKKVLKEMMHVLCGVCDEMWVELLAVKTNTFKPAHYWPHYKYGFTGPAPMTAWIYGQLFWWPIVISLSYAVVQILGRFL